jgi:hypothetical protein
VIVMAGTEIDGAVAALQERPMRVYAVCRKCAEVHLSDQGCQLCARRAALARPAASPAPTRFAGGTGPLPEPPPSGARAEPTSVAAPTRSQRRWHIATAVVIVYLIAVFGLLAAALGDCA